MSKIKKQGIVFFVIFSILLFMGNVIFNTYNVSAKAATSEESLSFMEQDKDVLKYHHEPTIEENFEDNIVNVILKSNYLGAIGFADFNGVEISEITYKLKTIYPRDDEKLIVNKNENSIITLKLATNDKAGVLKTIKKLQEFDFVLVAEPNYIYETMSDWVPSDAYYGAQWGLNGNYGINAESAWDITTGDESIKVGIFEDGVDLNHEDLKGYVFNGNFEGNSRDSHGTHVAGIIGSKQNISGVAGISKSKIYTLKRSSSSFTSSLEYATTNGIKIINASFCYRSTGTNPYAPYNSAHYVAIKNYDGLLVCSAGNENLDVDSNSIYPACYDLPNVISVGALKSNGQRPTVDDWGNNGNGNPQGSNYSSKGNGVDIYAPGDNILSTYPSELCSLNVCDKSSHVTNGYHYMSGTSMAAPHVTGVAALMLSENPNLTGSELKALILKGADEITINIPIAFGGTTKQNVKKLNAYNAVKYVDNSDSYNVVFLETTHNPIGYQNDIQILWIKNGDPWPASVGVPNAPFGYEFPGYFYTVDYAPNNYYTIYYDTGNFCNYNYYFKQSCFEAKADLVLQARWTPKIYHFGIGMKHSADNSESSISAVSKNYEESFSYSMAEENTVNGVTKGFSRWELTIKNSTTVFLSTEYSKSTTLEFEVKNIIDNYCRNYEELGKPDIYFFAIYDVELGGSCIAPGSMITLADGTLKPVEDLTGDEMLLVWDMKTGSFTSAPILFIDYDKPKECNVINLSFSDNTKVKVIYEHAFWDYDLNEYVFLREDAAQYIGHWFNKQTTDDYGNLTWSTVQLTDVDISLEYTSAYSPVTYSYLCYYVNGMLSMPGATEGLINIFEVNSDTMTYNQEAFESDVETYGLFTYEEFYEMLPVPEEVFNAFNGQYMKIAFGKGILTEEKLSALYSRYSKFFN